MSVPTDTILRAVASFLWTDGNIAQNVFNALLTGGGGPFDDQDVGDDANAWMNDMYANLTADMSTSMDGNSVTVYKYDAVGDDWDEVVSNSWGFNPTNATDQLPRGVAGLARLWTDDPDVQGKKYIPGLCEDMVDDGLFNAGALTDFLAFAADWYLPFVGSVSGATWTPGIWSVLSKVFNPGVDHIAAVGIPAYQRRRKRNVGI